MDFLSIERAITLGAIVIGAITAVLAVLWIIVELVIEDELNHMISGNSLSSCGSVENESPEEKVAASR